VGGALAAPSAPAPASAGIESGDRGDWRVEALGGDLYRITWTSPVRLPVTSDRPTIVATDHEPLGAPTVGTDRRTVVATVSADTRPDPADLDVVLSGDRLDVAGSDRTAAPAIAAAPDTQAADADPGLPGPFEVVTSDYELEPVKVPGLTLPIEMVGHVVEPAPEAVTGPRGLVLFLHGRHYYCYDPASGELGFDWPCTSPMLELPSHLGYDYIQRLLASQGYATVSIRVNGINAQDYRAPDGGAAARARVVRQHLDHWTQIAAEHQVDLSRVVLVGHSRGGEGVDRASIQIPLSAPYRIAGQVLIAPTNFGTQTAPYVPTVTLLPYCDGDVIDLQGQRYTDTGRDLTSDDTSLKSSVMVMGANHNFFNTEWTPGISAAPSFDDWWGGKDDACGRATDDRLRPAEQRAVGAAYVAGAVHLFADGDEEFLPMYDGSRVIPASAGDVDVRTHALGGGRVLRKPSLNTGLSLPQGAETQFCRGINDFRGPHDVCGRTARDTFSTPHWPGSYEQVPTRREFEMSWTAAGQVGGMVFPRPLDLVDRRLELRTIVDPALGGVRLRVRLTDADGASAVLTPAGDGVLPALLRGFGLSKRWAQTLLVDPTAAVGLDLARIAEVELIGDSGDGRVWVLDVAAAPSSLAAVPARRAPLVRLTNLRVEEGDGPGVTTARLPFHISGDVLAPARFVVVAAGQTRGDLTRYTIDVAPGQTSGSIPIDYVGDQRDDYDQNILLMAAWATRGLMTDRYLGQLTILDDDPMPQVTVAPVAKTVSEGERAEWRVRLDKSVDYDLFVLGRVVAGPKPELAGTDVPDSWLDRHGETDVGDTKPLHRLHVYVFERVRRGQREAILSIPIARDGVREPRESVTVKFEVGDRFYTRTIWVAASR